MTRLEYVERQSDHTEQTGRGIELSEIKETAKQQAQTVANRADVDAFEPVGLVGDAASQIVVYARQHGGSLHRNRRTTAIRTRRRGVRAAGAEDPPAV